MKARKIPYCGGSSTQHISFSPNPPSDTNNSWKSACVLSRCGFLPFSENVHLHDKALIPETETDSKILKPNLGLPKGEGWGEGWTGRVGMAYIHYWNPLVTRTCYIAWGKVFNTLWWPTWEKNLKKKEYIYIYTHTYMYMYGWFTLLYTWNYHNIVNHLHSDKMYTIFKTRYSIAHFLFPFASLTSMYPAKSSDVLRPQTGFPHSPVYFFLVTVTMNILLSFMWILTNLLLSATKL